MAKTEDYFALAVRLAREAVPTRVILTPLAVLALRLELEAHSEKAQSALKGYRGK